MHRRGSGCNSVVRTALAQHTQDSRFNFHDQKQKRGEWKGDTYNINLLRTISWITNEKHIVHSTGQCTQYYGSILFNRCPPFSGHIKAGEGTIASVMHFKNLDLEISMNTY